MIFLAYFHEVQDLIEELHHMGNPFRINGNSGIPPEIF
jgi:hypothetical protein